MVEANEGEAMKEQGRKAWHSGKGQGEDGDSTRSTNEGKIKRIHGKCQRQCLGQPDCDVAQRGHSPSAGVEEGYVATLNSE
jgi:hypothetical protein